MVVLFWTVCFTYGNGCDNIYIPDLPHLHCKARLSSVINVAKSDSNLSKLGERSIYMFLPFRRRYTSRGEHRHAWTRGRPHVTAEHHIAPRTRQVQDRKPCPSNLKFKLLRHSCHSLGSGWWRDRITLAICIQSNGNARFESCKLFNTSCFGCLTPCSYTS